MKTLKNISKKKTFSLPTFPNFRHSATASGDEFYHGDISSEYDDDEVQSNVNSNSSSPNQEGGVKPLYNLPITIWNGSILWKIPYNGRGIAEKRFVRLKRAPRNGASAIPIRIISRNRSENKIHYIVFPPTLVWSNPEKVDDINNSREVVLSGAVGLTEGYDSKAFLKCIETSKWLSQ